MSGALIALVSALLWAMASVLLTFGAKKIHVVPLNLIRCTMSTIFFWVLLPFYGGLPAIAAHIRRSACYSNASLLFYFSSQPAGQYSRQ